MKNNQIHMWLFLVLIMTPGISYGGSYAEVGPVPSPLEIDVGSATKLDVTGAKPGDFRWTSSTPQIAEVFSNGFVIGLAPGDAHVRASNATLSASVEYTVRIKPAGRQMVDPATLKQFPDNRQFFINGRKFFGSELNGQRAGPDEELFTRANRVVNPRPFREDKPKISFDFSGDPVFDPTHKTLDWEVAPGTEVFDGAGILMGTVAPTREVGGRRVPVSMFNFGASKVLHGRICIYAFSVSIVPSLGTSKSLRPNDTKDGRIVTSAWLPLDSVLDKETLLYGIGLGRNRLLALPLEGKGRRITGGNPQMYETPYGELSITRNVKTGAVPSHYLRRPSGTINLVYSVPGFGLGGEGADSFLLSDNLEFFPARGAKVFRQPTYFPAKHPQAGKESPQTMTFIYGAIKCGGVEPVYGWIAEEALAPDKGPSN